jgi:hypothetical protein
VRQRPDLANKRVDRPAGGGNFQPEGSLSGLVVFRFVDDNLFSGREKMNTYINPVKAQQPKVGRPIWQASVEALSSSSLRLLTSCLPVVLKNNRSSMSDWILTYK